MPVSIVRTRDDLSLFVLRIALGAVMLPHGLQKTAGLFGGDGFQQTMSSFTDKMHIPAPLAFLAIAAESAGAICLIVGLLTRVAAFGIGTVMVVAILTVHLHNGFFMNWFGTQKGEGFEYHLLAIGMALALIIGGGGKCSIDSLFSRFSLGDKTPTKEPGAVPIRERQAIPSREPKPLPALEPESMSASGPKPALVKAPIGTMIRDAPATGIRPKQEE